MVQRPKSVWWALLFILSLAGLSKHEKARAGVIYGITEISSGLPARGIWILAMNPTPARVSSLIMVVSTAPGQIVLTRHTLASRR
ncbi:hypothetical protein [Pseudarthrobacter sp. H2]|uniref:hypothetical protein n=1 Tax=Pseudarthrobacter sp. H2 TaxID=3418415 RepID=UPI003CF4B641